MSQPHVVNEFLTLLEESRLLSPEEVRTATAELNLAQYEQPRDAARALVKQGLLTRYQAERLLSGRTRGFFIDRYKVLEILGFGGMGSLYLAEDLESHDLVALKVLNERHKLDAGMLARLKLEAAAGVRLHHPQIVRTISVDDTGATCFVVMEFVKGISLFEYLSIAGPLPADQVCDVALQAAVGLQHSHESGIIHRDVKPENLIIDREGGVKILDFGLALLGDEGDSEFSLAMIFGHDCVGTPDYIAPEQSRDSQTVDGRADIYSLGCTMYMLLTGHPPYPTPKAVDKLEGHRNGQPKPLSEEAPQTPAAVLAVVERMMARDPADRYATMAEVAEVLRPLARRKVLNFSFNEILSQRAKEAHRRSQAASQSRPRPRLSSSIATASSVADAARRRAEQMETMTAGESDTRPSMVAQKSSGSAVRRRHLDPTVATGDAAKELTESLSRSLPAAVLVSLQDGRRIPLVRERVVLGRDEACDIVVAEPGVSGRHCLFHPEGTWWAVSDLDSKNGIEVNRTPAREQMLWPGDVIVVAHRYAFRIVDPNQPTARRGWGKRFAAVLAALAALAGLAGVLYWLTRG